MPPTTSMLLLSRRMQARWPHRLEGGRPLTSWTGVHMERAVDIIAIDCRVRDWISAQQSRVNPPRRAFFSPVTVPVSRIRMSSFQMSFSGLASEGARGSCCLPPKTYRTEP